MPQQSNTELDELYVKARRVLLDALQALGEQRHALILVGAQAIYVHTGEADFPMAPYTKDADLAIDPRTLHSKPALERVMEAAGFKSGDQPGTWIGRDDMPVDLLVPEAVSGPGRRGARLAGHDKRAARKVRGLEGTLVQKQSTLITSLEPGDGRSFQILVAGPTALLVAKLHKLWERRDAPGRLEDKDAADVFRLLRAISTAQLAEGSEILLQDPLSRVVTKEALIHLEQLFGERSGTGILMVRRATATFENAEVLSASCVELARDLLKRIRVQGTK